MQQDDLVGAFLGGKRGDGPKSVECWMHGIRLNKTFGTSDPKPLNLMLFARPKKRGSGPQECCKNADGQGLSCFFVDWCLRSQMGSCGCLGHGL